ncbi:AraC family transcriptional regulator N-terminal domain-containing protein [Marinobacter sp.]|uniref:AraC family transcriptional regulator n=1 Tax=Marinobacter sp. TaxID=50741 RepID=UPI0035C74D91
MTTDDRLEAAQKEPGQSEPGQEEKVLASLKDMALAIAHKPGDYATAIPELTVHRRDHAYDPIPCIYELGLAITLGGKKRVVVGQEVFLNEPGQGLLASVDLPLASGVLKASPQEPYLGMMLRLDPRLVLQVAAGLTLPKPSRYGGYGGLAQGTLDFDLLHAMERLLALKDEPRLLATLAPLIEQEIIARLLLGPCGQQFMALNAGGTTSRQIAQSMAWLKQNFAKAINIDALAEASYMSASTFRQHFKAIAGVSPLQYLKQVRLQEAKQLMLNEHLDAGAAGLRVGYESVSQFNREYARLFGQPPLRDIRTTREQLGLEA